MGFAIFEVSEEGSVSFYTKMGSFCTLPDSLIKTIEGLKLEEVAPYLTLKGQSQITLKREDEKDLLIVFSDEDEVSYSGFFYKIVESSHDEIYVCDHEGKTLYCNKTFEKNYGLSPQQMIGKTAMFLVEAGYSNQTPVEEVIKTKEAFTLPQTTATGKQLVITASPYLDARGNIEFIVENCRDITELEQIKKDLDKKEVEVEKYKNEAQSLKQLEGFEPRQKEIYESRQMRQLYELSARIAPTEATVLLLGETGTGKSHMAKYIHDQSLRREKPFISINCATLSPQLFESELFGYAPGAFTGASTRGKVGQVTLADGGTLFLDELGELSLDLQVKLLELIQEKRYTPVGSSEVKRANLRIIVATNRNLSQLVAEGRFREDLFYRLKVIEFSMPPLRERPEDLMAFLEEYLYLYNKNYGLNKAFSKETIAILKAYNWPGNVRELQNLVHNLVLMSAGSDILPADLPSTLILDYVKQDGQETFGDWQHLMEAYEQVIIQRAYGRAGSSYKLAELLNISQSKASRLMRKYLKA